MEAWIAKNKPMDSSSSSDWEIQKPKFQSTPKEEFDDLKEYIFYHCPRCDLKTQDPYHFRAHLKSYQESTPDISQIIEEATKDADTCVDSTQIERLQNFAKNNKSRLALG